MPTEIHLTGRVLESIAQRATDKSSWPAGEFLSYLQLGLSDDDQEEASRILGFDVSAIINWSPEDFPFEDNPDYWRPPSQVRDMLNRIADLIGERKPETERFVIGMIDWLGWVPKAIAEPERTDSVRRMVVEALQTLADTAQRFLEAGESLVCFQHSR